MIRSTLIPLCLASLAALPASAVTAPARAQEPQSEACTPLTVAAQGKPGAVAPSWTRAAQIRNSAIYQLGREGGGSLLDGTEPCWDAERNVVRIDFGGRAVPARDLAHLLTAPGLLPAFAHGGLVVTDAAVTGTLRLERAVLDYPLELRELVFADPQSDEVRGKPRELVLHIDSSTLKQPVEVVGSHLNGLALIENSRFDESLNFSGNVFHAAADGTAGEEEGPATTSRSLQILYTEIGGKLRLTKNRFDGRVFLDHSDVAYAEVEDNTLVAGMFAARKNAIGKLSLERNAFGGGLEVANNRVSTLLDVVDGEIGPVEGTDEFAIRVNRIGGTVYFGPERIAPGVKRLDLTFNEITGPAEIALPDAWPPAEQGEQEEAGVPYSLDLTSTEVGSRLALELIEADHGTAATGDGGGDVPDGGAADRRDHHPDAYCYERTDERTEAVVWLTNVTLDTLAWRLPRGCRYAWAGTGLTYQSLGGSNVLDAPERGRAAPEEPDADATFPIAFVPAALAAAPRAAGADEAEAATAPDNERARRDAWRYAMAEPNADALTFLAQHLRARGEFTESREALMEAKRLDYTPPDRCFVEAPFVAAAVPLYDVLDRDCLTRGVGYMFLFPTGFGVKPERAFLWLFGGWFAGWALYCAYHYRRRWANGWRPRLAALRRRLAEPRNSRQRNGACHIEGFARYDNDKNPKDFRLWIFSADAMLPVVNLHSYESYFPESFGMRLVSYTQNVLGWFVVTSLFAALTVL